VLARLWSRLAAGGADAGRQPVRTGGGLLALGAGGSVPVAGRSEERIDVPVLLLAAALVLLGVVMVYSASITLADSPRYKVTPTHFLARHLFAIAVATVAAVVAFSVPMSRWQRLAPVAFLVALALLVVVLVPGVGTGALGARRWIPLAVFNLQPSELMKVACVLYAASFTVRKQDYMHSLKRGFLPIGLVMLAVGVLLQLQPDLGAFIVIVAIAMGILFLGGLNVRLFVAITVLLALGLAAIVWLFPYRRERIFAYLDPWAAEHVLNKGYQLTHSLIAFGRGEWFGVGLGGSVEKLHYLTEAHTDFIVAVIAEELGLVAVLAVIVAFYWLTKRAFEIGRQAVALERTFAGLVAQGIGIWIGVQSFINIGVASGLLPTKGLTLPLVSYGGSAMLATGAAIGLLLRVDYENRVLMRGGRA
jgi:cell division protein FtsW